MDTLMTDTGQTTAPAQTNMAAMMKSGQIWSEGLAELSKSTATMLQARMERASALMKALGGASSLKEAFDIRMNHAQTSLADAIADTARLTEFSTKLAIETMAPLKEQMTAAVGTFTKSTVPANGSLDKPR